MLGNLAIEPLDTKKHDRAAFSSGVEQVDNFLHKRAGKLVKGETARVFVAIDTDHPPEVIRGFYSINAHSVHCGELPNRYRRYAQPDGSIPGAFIGMIGVDQSAQRQGIGGILLTDALKRAFLVSQQIGTAVVMLDILDCGNPEVVERRQRLYEGYGFESLDSDPLRMFMPMGTVAQLCAPGEATK
jgi:ribosomal protein S18 acetylase RimI-like enzyme